MAITPSPKYMSPGSRSVAGSGLTSDAFGEPQPSLPAFMPAGVSLQPKGPGEVNFYNGAQPATVGGGVREAQQIKSGPMGQG